jgi:hypothetical protein
MLGFGDRVVVIAVDDIPDLVVGDRGEVVGMSDDGHHVGVMIDRFERVYTLAVGQVQA